MIRDSNGVAGDIVVVKVMIIVNAFVMVSRVMVAVVLRCLPLIFTVSWCL